MLRKNSFWSRTKGTLANIMIVSVVMIQLAGLAVPLIKSFKKPGGTMAKLENAVVSFAFTGAAYLGIRVNWSMYCHFSQLKSVNLNMDVVGQTGPAAHWNGDFSDWGIKVYLDRKCAQFLVQELVREKVMRGNDSGIKDLAAFWVHKQSGTGNFPREVRVTAVFKPVPTLENPRPEIVPDQILEVGKFVFETPDSRR